MLCFLMYFLTSFIFLTTFAVIDYIDDDRNKSLDTLMNFEHLPDKIPIYFTTANESFRTTYLGDPIERENDSDLVIDLLKLRYVLNTYASGCDLKGIEIFIEHLDKSRKLSKCITTITGARCRSLVRKLVIRKMPKNCALHVMGYTSHLNWYLGCIKAEHGNNTLSRSSNLTSYEECTRMCDKNDYIGLFMVGKAEACKCFRNLNGIVSAKQALCWKLCPGSYDYCGGDDSYISLYLSEQSRASNISIPECLFRGHNCLGCGDGWRGYNCELSDCETSNGNCGSMECHNLTVWGERFRTCSCGDGYKLSDVWGKCNDIDECADKSNCPEGQICTNTEGSFACDCQEGYQIGETGACTDFDECNTPSLTICDIESTICVNNVGSYSCKCRDGFRIDNMTGNVCKDIDECADEPYCQTCINTLGSFACDCQEGYQKAETGSCTDVDECNTLSVTFCDAVSTICFNNAGSYSCHCRDGFRNDNMTSNVCEDIDECAEASICSEGQICTNTEGSFACDCQEGYQKAETGACTDVDECHTLSVTICDIVSTFCVNNAGSFSCHCRDGFRSDNMTSNVCEDLDECLANPCDRTSTNCRNIPGSFDCSCFLGYHKIGYFRCEDDDECGSLFRKCPIGVPCVNVPGTYQCYCPTGTKKNVQFYGTDCDDIDECLDDYICDQTSSVCVNAVKSYACICRLEFVQVDNFTCKAQDAIFTRASTQTVSSEIFTNEPAEESSTTSNAFYFGLGLVIILCMFSCCGCLCFAAKNAKSVISNQSSASEPSIEMEVHVEENIEY